jgi:hypothetical protein
MRSFVRSCDYDSEQGFWRAEIQHNSGYQGAQQYFITRELREGRPRSALQLAHHWFRGNSDSDGLEASRATLVLNILQAVLALTPDADRASLTAVRDFARALADGQSPLLELPALSLQLRVGGDQLLLDSLKLARRRLDLIVADAVSRLGDDAGTFAAVDRVTRDCASCWTLLSSAAIAVARAGALSRAEGLARDAERFGPPGNAAKVLDAIRLARQWDEQRMSLPSPMSEAGFYAALGAYGRAYAAAAEAIHNPPEDPHSRRALAELAFRAGDVRMARRLLEGAVPSQAAVQAILSGLSRTVAWKDKPLHHETWVPDSAG